MSATVPSRKAEILSYYEEEHVFRFLELIGAGGDFAFVGAMDELRKPWPVTILVNDRTSAANAIEYLERAIVILREQPHLRADAFAKEELRNGPAENSLPVPVLRLVKAEVEP